MIPNSRTLLARLARAVVAIASVVVGTAAVAPGATAAAEPVFGDSNWVAPVPAATDPTFPDGTGPRVAEPRGEPLGETILRTPFRVAFLPLRLVARGFEGLAGHAGPGGAAWKLFSLPAPPFVLHPVFFESGASGLSFGVGIDREGTEGVIPGFQRALASYSLRDSRRLAADFRFGAEGGPQSLGFQAVYDFRPNRRFYGMGNGPDRGDRTIYLEEETRLGLDWRIGRSVARRLDVLASWSDISARTGYNSKDPGALEVFDPGDAPFLLRGSEVGSVGLAGRWGALDDLRDPSTGIDLRARAEAFKATDGTGIEYQRYRTEARAYAPVAAPRRVIALRAVHDWVQPSAGSVDVPFYRLPESAGSTRFAAYNGRQFRDHHIAVGRAEYRWIIVDRVWLLGLAELGQVAARSSDLRWADLHESYGGGLRYAIDDERVARVEVAHGAQGTKLRILVGEEF
jgi:hypothetical protein